jgi:hypothetical protein
MTLSEKKEYLNLYKIHNAKIRRLKELIGDYPDESEKYKENLHEAKLMKDKIEKEIELLDNPILVEVLAQKYQCGKTLEEIAYCMNYSTRQIERLHLKALNEFKVL